MELPLDSTNRFSAVDPFWAVTMGAVLTLLLPLTLFDSQIGPAVSRQSDVAFGVFCKIKDANKCRVDSKNTRDREEIKGGIDHFLKVSRKRKSAGTKTNLIGRKAKQVKKRGMIFSCCCCHVSQLACIRKYTIYFKSERSLFPVIFCFSHYFLWVVCCFYDGRAAKGAWNLTTYSITFLVETERWCGRKKRS